MTTKLGPMARNADTPPRSRRKPSPQPTEPPPWENRGAFMGEPTEDITSEEILGADAVSSVLGLSNPGDPGYTTPPPLNNDDVVDGRIMGEGYIIDGERKKTRLAKKVEQSTLGYLGIGQLLLLGKQDMYCAKELGKVAPKIAENMGQIADDFPLIANMMTKADKWSAIFGLVVAVGQFGITMGVHHNVLPYNELTKFIVPPLPEREKF